MLHDLINFHTISRKVWQNLGPKSQPPLSEKELNSIKSLNDQINIQDVTDIYLPLINLIKIYKNNSEHLSFSKNLFFRQIPEKRPFIIGISGSVAVGKSTTSRLLQLLLSRTFKDKTVELITTDGFLYPNAVLRKKNLLHQKGFPDSYNMPLLIKSLGAIKSGLDCDIPVYSHNIYDIIPNATQTISSPDILIIEGINVFQSPQNSNLYTNGYFDFSIYIDAEEKHIKNWYLERFNKLINLAKTDKNNYYYRFSQMPLKEAHDIAKNTWDNINRINLNKYIKPTRNRAEIILHKNNEHKIDKIYVKK